MLLLAFCLLLAVICVVEWLVLPAQLPLVEAPDEREENTSEIGFESANSFTLPVLTEFDSIEERPLFIEGRRPRPPAETGVQEDVTKPRGGSRSPKLNLSAILIINDEPMALLRNPPKEGPARLKMGDEFQGWRVEKIAADRITLKQGGEREEFLLREYKKVPLPRVTKRTKRRPVKSRRRVKPRPPLEKIEAVDSLIGVPVKQ